jgi:hypothetical protein
MASPNVLDHSDPTVAAIDLFDNTVDSGLLSYEAYEGPYLPDGIVYIPGEMQTEDWARQGVDWAAGQVPAAVRDYSVNARQRRLDLLVSHTQSPLTLYVLDRVVVRNPRIDEEGHIAAIMHMCELAAGKTADVRLRLVPSVRLAGDPRLVDVQSFRALETSSGAPILITDDLGRYDLPKRIPGRLERSFGWRQALGEVALSPDETLAVLERAAA